VPAPGKSPYLSDFPEKLSQPDQMYVVNDAEPANPTLESIEKAYIHFVMSQTDGKKSKAAKILGIDTSTLYRKIDRYNLKECLSHRDDEKKPER
jgi:DNA-binding NtrC family response regulator